MNVYENIIEDVKAVKVKTNAAGVLEQFKKYLEDIKTKVVHTHTQYKTMLEKFAAAGYTAAYIQEWEEKERGNYESNLLAGIDQVVEQMGADLKALKESVRVRTGDKEVSANNLLKLQAILPGLSIEDKEQLFQSVADRDPNVLEVLYFNVKNQDPVLAEKIMDKMDEFTGNKQISIVEKEYEQLAGLKSYLTFDAVKSMGEGFSAVDGVTLTIEGTVDRILEAYLQEIDRKIEEVKKIES